MSKSISKAMCLPAIFNALNLASGGANSELIAITEAQRCFLTDYLGGGLSDIGLLKDYIKGIVTHDSDELNRWFFNNGFPDIDVNIASGGVGVGSIFDLLVDWIQPGEKATIYSNHAKSNFAGVEMLCDTGVRGWSLEGYMHPMFEISTKHEGWKVFLVKSEEVQAERDIPKQALEFLSLKRTPFEFVELHFPKVSMEKDIDISFLVGLQCSQNFIIDRALKKVRLRLNEKGASAKSAVSFSWMSGPMNLYVIDMPFFIIFWKQGLKFPAFVALSTFDTWVREEV